MSAQRTTPTPIGNRWRAGSGDVMGEILSKDDGRWVPVDPEELDHQVNIDA
jgi:hypothetical protein